jgi:DNA invertase Pin-like site-specific DNA recombinase
LRAFADRAERRKVIDLARKRLIDVVLVTELSRWGRSTRDLVETLDDLHGWGVDVVPLNSGEIDLTSASGKLMRGIIAVLAEFERDLLRERINSGMARVLATIERDGHFTRPAGKRPSEKHAEKIRELREQGLSYRLIGRNLGLSKNTVMALVQRDD